MRSISNPVAALLEPGYRVDDYELLAKIGQGGMASVWLARDNGGKFFAIKTILPQHAADEQLRKMMLDEARIAMAIDHPNVARTLEVGQLWDMPYLVLEYVPGESLDQLCQALASKELSVPPDIAVRIVADTCTGLHAAHELVAADGKPLEIVHRDLSTHNILVDERGVVKLIDFGVAKAAERLAETASGVTKGKAPYTAPEQALDAFVDRRADLWSMGAVMYVLLTGKYPYDGPTDAVRMARKLSGDPPTPLADGIPTALREVVERALSFYREARQETAAELGAALEASVRAPATTASVASFFAENLAPARKARGLIVEHALGAAAARARAKEMLGGSVPSSRRGRARAGAGAGAGGAGAGATGALASSARMRAAAIAAAGAAGGAGATDEGPSVATIGGPKHRSSQKPWLAYVSAAAITLIVIVAFVLGSRTGRGGEVTAVPAVDDPVHGGARPTSSPTTTGPVSVPSLTVASGRPSPSVSAASALPSPAPVPAPTPTPTPSAASSAIPSAVPASSAVPSATPSASAPRPKPVPEDTIF